MDRRNPYLPSSLKLLTNGEKLIVAEQPLVVPSRLLVQKNQKSAEATTRKPTRPAPLSCRRVRAMVSAPTPLPKGPSAQTSKRRVDMTPSVLAKKVAHRSSKTSREIADELASTYAMSSAERRTNENPIRAMRAAN